MNNIIFIGGIKRGFAWNIIRSLFGWLDYIAYTLFSWIMQLIFDIVAVSSDPAFNSFYEGIHTRIYAILAIFMLFKITISMLSYLVNPDSISDKERGIGKMATRVIVSLVMLIAFPYAFTFLNQVQPHILEALPRVILGSNSGSLSDQMGSAGEQIAFDTYNGVWFNTDCADNKELAENGKRDLCFAHVDVNGYPTVATALEHINDPADNDSSSYRYNYFPLLGFVTAIVMTIILLGYCIDVAIRVFKLIILQIIAPIPIISYIDPKSSKDGAFSKWLKMVGSVYLDLFIKLGVIYFVLLVISELITSGTVINVAINLFGNTGIVRSGLVLVAIVIGLLFFAKQAPKFICDSLGIKMSENGSLFGGLGKIMAAGAIGAGALGAGIASGKASYMADEENGKNHNAARMLKNVGAGLLGGIGGLGTGASAAMNAKDHYSKAAMDAMAKRNSTALAAGAAGSTAFGRALSTGTGLLFGETSAAKGKREIAAMEAKKSALETVKSRVSGEMVKKDWTKGLLIGKDKNGNDATDLHGNVIGEVNYKSFIASMNAAKAAGENTVNFQNANGDWIEISMRDAEFNQGYLLKNNESNYIEQHVNGTVAANEVDEILMADISNAEKITGNSIHNRNDVNNSIDSLGVQIMNAKRENSKKEQNDRFSGSGK